MEVFIKWCFLVALMGVANSQIVDRRINITVVTTAGCGDTLQWIQNQLKGVWLEFGGHMDLKFVPWGRTTRSADGSLNCQFGEADCWANRLHRCAISLLKNQGAQMQYMDCEFQSATNRPAFLQRSYACSDAAGIPRFYIDQCMETSVGDELALQAEAESALPMQIINFVPAIVINDTPNWNVFVMAFLDFRPLVCSLLAQDGITAC